MLPTRAGRLAQQIQQEVATIIHQEVKDPGVGFVTITRVTLSPDGRYAKVYFSCLGDAAQRQQSQQVLDRSVRFIYGLLKKRLRLKIIPILEFKFDESIEGTIGLEQAFERLKQPPPTP
jgi:ribosome-binding factor A